MQQTCAIDNLTVDKLTTPPNLLRNHLPDELCNHTLELNFTIKGTDDAEAENECEQDNVEFVNENEFKVNESDAEAENEDSNVEAEKEDNESDTEAEKEGKKNRNTLDFWEPFEIPKLKLLPNHLHNNFYVRKTLDEGTLWTVLTAAGIKLSQKQLQNRIARYIRFLPFDKFVKVIEQYRENCDVEVRSKPQFLKYLRQNMLDLNHPALLFLISNVLGIDFIVVKSEQSEQRTTSSAKCLEQSEQRTTASAKCLEQSEQRTGELAKEKIIIMTVTGNQYSLIGWKESDKRKKVQTLFLRASLPRPVLFLTNLELLIEEYIKATSQEENTSVLGVVKYLQNALNKQFLPQELAFIFTKMRDHILNV